MKDSMQCGVLLISVDATLAPDQTSLAEKRLLDRGIDQLLKLLEARGMNATVALPNPACSTTTEKVLAAGARHEVALLGDRSWIGSPPGRAVFTRTLLQRTNEARDVGLSLSTLVLHDVELTGHLDLLVKQQVTAIRERRVSKGGRSEPRCLRYGIRRFPVSGCLPVRGRGLSRLSASNSVRRAIKRAARHGTVVQVAIDGAALVAGNLAQMTALEQLLGYAGRWRDTGRLAIETMAAHCHRLMHQRASAPTRSILRPAA